LTWHGITTDIDPTTGTVAYSRGGKPLSPETTVGHRPTPDPTAVVGAEHPRAQPVQALPEARGMWFGGM